MKANPCATFSVQVENKKAKVELTNGNVIAEVKKSTKEVFQGNTISAPVADAWLNAEFKSKGYSFVSRQYTPAKKTRAKHFVVEVYFDASVPEYNALR